VEEKVRWVAEVTGPSREERKKTMWCREIFCLARRKSGVGEKKGGDKISAVVHPPRKKERKKEKKKEGGPECLNMKDETEPEKSEEVGLLIGARERNFPFSGVDTKKKDAGERKKGLRAVGGEKKKKRGAVTRRPAPKKRKRRKKKHRERRGSIRPGPARRKKKKKKKKKKGEMAATPPAGEG